MSEENDTPEGNELAFLVDFAVRRVIVQTMQENTFGLSKVELLSSITAGVVSGLARFIWEQAEQNPAELTAALAQSFGNCFAMLAAGVVLPPDPVQN